MCREDIYPYYEYNIKRMYHKIEIIPNQTAYKSINIFSLMILTSHVHGHRNAGVFRIQSGGNLAQSYKQAYNRTEG